MGAAVISYFAKDSIVEFFNGKSEIQDNNTDSAQMKNVNDFGVWPNRLFKRGKKRICSVGDKKENVEPCLLDKSKCVTHPLEEEYVELTDVSPLKYDYGSNIAMGTWGYLNVILLSIIMYFAKAHC